jgi:hypothetical protein
VHVVAENLPVTFIRIFDHLVLYKYLNRIRYSQNKEQSNSNNLKFVVNQKELGVNGIALLLHGDYYFVHYSFFKNVIGLPVHRIQDMMCLYLGKFFYQMKIFLLNINA